MSCIRQLYISGIRNFGTEGEPASIKFSCPLTLILGQNGTGKTTIIEALKFATCGEFPPGSDRGKFFIHDPTLTTTSSVRGVVKVEIINASGNMYTISRTIESKKGPSAIKFKTLDNTLSRHNKTTREVVSITNRCSNVDTEITLAMGVSKSILDNVIFCHQEDLSWPFQDGKKLKEKFDEIFDSVRFNKALENIMKYSKELKQKVQILKEQKHSCQLIVSEVQEKEAKLKDHKNRLKTSKIKIEELKQDLEPVNKRIEILKKLDAEYKELLSEERQRKAEYDMSLQQLETLKKELRYVFTGSTEELIQKIESYDDVLLTKDKKLQELDEKLIEVSEKEFKISHKLGNERVTIGSLRQQIHDQEKQVAFRNKLLNHSLTAWNLENVDINVSEMEVLVHFKRLQGKLRELEQQFEEKRLKREAEENEVQKTVDDLRSEHSKIESEQHLKEKEISEIRGEINKIKLEIVELGTAANKLHSIENETKKAEAKLQKLNDAMDLDAAKKTLTERIESRDKMETQLNILDEEISSLLKQSSLQAELELNKSTMLAKEKEIQALRKKHEEKILNLLDRKELPKTKLKNELDLVQKGWANEIEKINREIQEEEKRRTTLETTIMHVERELQNKIKEINSDKRKIEAICDYKNFDETLTLQSRKVKDLQDKRGMYAHQTVAYKEYMKNLKDTDPCCPLCHRGFNEVDDVTNLLKKMEREMENHPTQLRECEKELKVQQEKYDNMLQLRPVVEKVIKLEDDQLENLRQSLESSKVKLNKSSSILTDLKEKKSKPDKKLEHYKNVLNDVMSWDRCMEEMSKIKKKIDDLDIHFTAAGITTKYTLEEAQTQRDFLKTSIKNIRDDIDEIQSKINLHNDRLHCARQEHHLLQEKCLKLKSDMQKVKELKDKQNDLYAKEISLGTYVDTLRLKVAEAEMELKAEIEKLEKKKKENWENQEIDRKLLTEGTRRLSELQKAQDEVDAFTHRNIPDLLEKSEATIKKYEDSLNTFLDEKTRIEKQMNELKEEVSRHEVRKRELSDNLSLRRIQETTEGLQKSYNNVQEKLRAINHSKIVDECKDIQNRKQHLLRQENILMGNQEELERVVDQYTQDLKKETYRLARRNFKHKCIELTVADQAVSNLNAYSKALDSAMIKYHEERMATVNRITKEMWKLVYTGTDTTSIEIRTDATQGVGTTKRTYNYKLVQTKHGHEIDMKGRCSAGQKVLASIIIRLALAETFCKECGILALDEPTTNLDDENARSLASALATVVKLRSRRQKNFQLIVISHDDKFLFKLAELNSSKVFYELYRKSSGYSAIKHCFVGGRDYSTLDTAKDDSSPTRSPMALSSSSSVSSPVSPGPSREGYKDSGKNVDSLNKASNESGRKRLFNDSDRDDDDDGDHAGKRAPKKRYIFN